MNKMLEKNVIGYKGGGYSVLSLQSFFISQVLPAGKIIKESFGDIVSTKESAVAWYADYTQDTLSYILAKVSPAFYPACPELRPMQLSIEELLQDFSTGLSCFVREIEGLLSQKENSSLKEYSSSIKEFIKVIPLIKFNN